MSRLTITEVDEYIRGVCFKTGPPGRVGAETEWLVVDIGDPAAHVPLDRLAPLMDAIGPLPGGSRVTYEPGGQLELSSAPFPELTTLHAALAADLDRARGRLARHGLALAGHGIDPLRGSRLQVDGERYRCMSAYFGAAGLAPMCSTASVQVCVDIGADHADALRRWRLSHSLGPVLLAAFANSPLQAGRRTGLRSTRQAVWTALDPGRTEPPAGADPVAAWTRYALDARVMLVRDRGTRWRADPGMTFRQWISQPDGGAPGPTLDDLQYHLSTLFPPVRPRGWLELRMIDAVPDPYWPVPVAVATALLDDPRAAAVAAEATRPVAGRWREAARDALTDRALAVAAARCFEAATAALPRLGAADLVPLVREYAERYVARGRCPADDLVSSVSTQRRAFRGAADPATR